MSSERPPRDPILRAAMTKAAAPEPSLRPFVHLRVHSAYSLLEGALPVKKIVAHALKDAAPAIAITDTNNLFGALEFAQYAVKDGIQPVIGCQIDVAFGDENQDANRGYQKRPGPELFPLVLIAAMRQVTAISSGWSAAPIWTTRPERRCRFRSAGSPNLPTA